MAFLETNWLLSRFGTSNRLPSKLSAAEVELQHDLSFVRAIVIVGFLVGLGGLFAYAVLWYKRSGWDGFTDGFTIFFWALACYALGSLVGFLFGIPRVLQGHPANPTSQSASANSGSRASATYQLLINTNLDDISDWLTKIVVGVGLVELQALPGSTRRLAVLITGKHGELVPFAISVILYFTILGFMSGYLTTRMFIQRAFRASDLAAGGISTPESPDRINEAKDDQTTPKST